MKNKYIEYSKKTFQGSALELVLKQIEMFYNDEKINKTKYDIGDDVLLKKGTFIHGIPGGLENLDWVVENGFIGTDFTSASKGKNKIKNSVGMWNIKEDTLLREYIYNYSGFTVTYTIGRGPDSKQMSELIPYHQFDEVTERINNDEEIWTYWGDQTKEIRFLPSLVADKVQIAFILNMDSDYAREMSYADVWNIEFDGDILKEFLDYRYYEKFLVERLNRNASTTDRESAIMFGLPSGLIEGVFVGRRIEADGEALSYIKSKLSECYICNLDGKVIVGNNS